MAWYNPLDWIDWGTSNGVHVGTIGDLTAERAAINAREAELDAKAGAKYGADWTAQVDQHRAEENAVTYDAQVNGEFVKGASEGLQAEQSVVKKAIAAPINWTFGAIPWQLWVIAAIALWVYMGGWTMLRGRLAK